LFYDDKKKEYGKTLSSFGYIIKTSEVAACKCGCDDLSTRTLKMRSD
jgi:hypothetical protein